MTTKVAKKQNKKRCAWVGESAQMQAYHDKVWGVPKKKDIDIFEAIVLDTFQAGLSWAIILRKRDNFARAFANFDPVKVARFGVREEKKLLQDAGIVRNKLKIKGTIQNAKSFLAIQKEYGTFAKYIWQFTNGKVIDGKRKTTKDIPATSKESDAMSKDLKKRGFTFVGSTVCYAFMQGIGMVNDHTKDCFRYAKK